MAPARVLITGASGLAGGYLFQACVEAGEQVVGASRSGSVPDGDRPPSGRGGSGMALDLRDGERVRRAFRELKPEVVYHLASLSSVGRSWEEPSSTVADNVATALNVLEALRLEAPEARTVWVSSCQVYGSPSELPVEEDAPLHPSNPYAVSKASGEMLAGVYADAYGLRIVTVRPFNHAGPGQRSIFILSSVARQGAEARLRGAERVRVLTGNPETRRDFTDVRDVVRAYRLLAEPPVSGVFNVSTGRSLSAAEQVKLLGELIAPIEVEHVVDPDWVRGHEVMDLRGSHERISSATGWQPEIPLRQTMLDTIEWWERELGS